MWEENEWEKKILTSFRVEISAGVLQYKKGMWQKRNFALSEENALYCKRAWSKIFWNDWYFYFIYLRWWKNEKISCAMWLKYVTSKNTSKNNLRSSTRETVTVQLLQTCRTFVRSTEVSDKARLCMSEEKGIACKRRDQRSFETIDTSHRESMVLSPPPESTGTIAERSFETIDTFATSNCV